MDDLRREIRAAFEQEQSAYPPVSTLRPKLVRAAAAKPRPGRNLQWLAVAAALMLAVLVVVGLLSSRLTLRGTVSPPKASPSAAPTLAGDYGPPPAGVNLIWLHDPNHAGWLIGYDWTGKPRGTVKLGGSPTGVTMAPNGQSFSLGVNAKGGNWQFLDRLGQPAASGSVANAFGTMWADDYQHICTISFDPQTFAYTLWTLHPGDQPVQVAEVARDTQIGQSVVSLAACSYRNDSAIAVRTTVAWPSEYWVIKLSTGEVLIHRMLPGSTVATVVASPDATLIAESSSRSTGSTGEAAPNTVIKQVVDGKVVSTIDPAFGVLGFSADNSVALVTLKPWVGGQPANIGTIDVASGTGKWQDQGTSLFGGFVAEPAGGDFVLAYPTSGQQGPGPATILIVHADGTVTKIANDYAPTW